jgi:hypothetical protein
MLDRYASRSASHVAPAVHGFAVTPSDSTDLSEIVRALYIGAPGDVATILKSGATVTFKNLAAGTILPVRASRIKATGTTAADIIGLV